MKNHQVKNLFIFFLVFLPLQYAMVGVIGHYKSEPWPAFVFPGFKNVYVYEDEYELSNAVVEIHLQNSEIIELSPKEFFSDILPSQISGFMRTQFSSEENAVSYGSETKEWLRKHAEEITARSVSDVQIVWLKKFYTNSGRTEMEPDSTAEEMRYSLLNGGENDD